MSSPTQETIIFTQAATLTSPAGSTAAAVTVDFPFPVVEPEPNVAARGYSDDGSLTIESVTFAGTQVTITATLTPEATRASASVLVIAHLAVPHPEPLPIVPQRYEITVTLSPRQGSGRRTLEVCPECLKATEPGLIRWVSKTPSLEIIGIFGLPQTTFLEPVAAQPATESLEWTVTNLHRRPFKRPHRYSIFALDTTTGQSYFKDPQVTNEEGPEPPEPAG